MTVLKKKAWSRRGVSDIVGNLLILAITVTLFTSILYFVSSMPGPGEKVYTDAVSSVSLDFADNKGTVSVTHKGGETLYDSKTNIIIIQDNSHRLFHISDDPTLGDTWSAGQTWSITLDNVYTNTSLSIMIVDTSANTVVYDNNLMGGYQAASAYPIIGNRGLNPSPTYIGDKVQFYATITCPYADLVASTIYIDASSLGLGNVALYDPDGDNVYWSDASTKYTTTDAWNGKTVIVNADNDRGEHSEARLVLTVLTAASGGDGEGNNPYYNYPDALLNGTYPPDASGGEASGSVGITWYKIKNANGDVTHNFSAGEKVYIELWSDTIANAALQNLVNVIHPLTGEPIASCSSSTAFKYAGAYNTFRMFTYNFTAPTDSYAYTLQIKIKDNLGVGTNINDYIVVGNRDYPLLTTYKVDSSGNLIRSTQFNHTDTVYILIETKDVDLSASTVTVNDLQVSEFSGQYIVQKSCPAYTNPPTYSDSSKPISSVFKTNGVTKTPGYEGTSNGVYTFYMVLFDAYQGWWLPGTNTYTLKINTFMDQGTSGYGEVYYSLSCQFAVTAPLTTTDILASIGQGTFTWSASGAEWSSNKVVWYKGGDQWDYDVIDDDPSDGPLALGLFDINGDGRNDALVGSQSTTSANIVWYANQKIDGSEWSSARTIAEPFDAYSGLNVQTTKYTKGILWETYTWYGGTSTGLANEDATLFTGDSNGQTFVSSYGGTSYNCQNEICAQLAVADFDGDGDGDIVASFVHIVVYTTARSASEATASNSFGMYFNRGVYVYWNDGNEWSRTTLYSTNDWITNGTCNSNGNPAAADLAVGDLNQDGYPDVVAVYQDGTTKVWLNQWLSTSGNLSTMQNGAFGAGSLIRLQGSLNVGGHNPWEHTVASEYQPVVEVADMDGDGYPDIVRTSTQDNSVYILYTSRTGSSSVTFSPDSEYALNETLYADVTGSMANLRYVDDVYEVLSEVYYNYNCSTLHAQNRMGTVTTSPLYNTYYNDSLYYVFEGTTYSVLYGYTPETAYQGKTVSKALLKVTYAASSDYVGSAHLQYSIDGINWYDTAIVPTGGLSGYMEVDLLALGVDTWSEINSLMIEFQKVDSAGTVSFDMIALDVQFVQSRVMGWEWEIENSLRATHNLTMWAYITGDESFLIQYSVDNETWFNAFVVSSTTKTEYSCLLPFTSNSHYYIRVYDEDYGTDETTGKLYIDQLVIVHSTQTVTWPAKEREVQFSSSSQYITALAIGDMDKRTGVYSNGLLDIVISTSVTDSTHALFIATQTSKGSFTAQPVLTTALGTACSDTIYDTHAVELGDIDGDSDLDIVLIVGASFGQTPGSAPTMWLYYNNQQQDTSGTVYKWTFTEEPINALSTEGQSAINIKLGYIDLSIFLPILGVVGIAAVGGAVERRRTKKE